MYVYIYIVYIAYIYSQPLAVAFKTKAFSMAVRLPLGRRSQRIWRTKTILAVRRLTVRPVSRGGPETWQKKPGDAVSEGSHSHDLVQWFTSKSILYHRKLINYQRLAD